MEDASDGFGNTACIEGGRGERQLTWDASRIVTNQQHLIMLGPFHLTTRHYLLLANIFYLL